MQRARLLCLAITILCLSDLVHGQSADDAGKLIDLPSHFLRKIEDKTAYLDGSLTKQTEKYLQKMQRREVRLQTRLYKTDSNAAKSLFAGAEERYAALSRRIATDTGNREVHLTGEYHPYSDSLQGMLKFLEQQNPSGTQTGASSPQLQSTMRQLQALQAKMQDAEEVKQFVQHRKQQLGDCIQQHANLSSLLGKDYNGMNQDLYYYSQQIRQYKAMLNDPDKLEQQALALLNKLPAFQAFMKQNSQLAGLFNLPGNYGTPQGLAGLQTRDQVSSLIQGQVSAGGAGGTAALQSNLQSAESQLDGYKDKLSKLGGGSGDIDMPDFKPNDQKTKTFWKRLEYGANFQTTRNNYYFPTVTDLGLSVGYKLGNANLVGLGASYKIGWGNGIQHIALSSQGIGLRSFIDIKIKSSFSASGGFEYNYCTPFTSYQQIRQIDQWTKSGLIGISKTVSVKSRVFSKTKLSLLWDFLSYQQMPKTQALLFRIGYAF